MAVLNKKEVKRLLIINGFKKVRSGKGSNEIWKKGTEVIKLSLYPERGSYHRIVKLCEL